MAHWNYRIIYHPPSTYKIGEKEFDREEYLAIHEVHYDDNNKPHMVTIDEMIVGDEGKESLESLKEILKDMALSLDKPILNYKDF